ncbi:MAG: VWA domain-containing protein [Planctomycetes bacterium]|nr:VWA domain-containing protein [Planctomycetota bacterium]
MSELLESVFGFVFADPWMGLGLLLIPLALWLRARRGKPAMSIGAAGPLAAVPGTWRTRLLGLPPVLHALGIALAVAAMARPVVRDRVPQNTEGVDILLVMDLSSSMREVDMDPAEKRTRLDVAKTTAAEFVRARRNDRIGLVTFAAFPDMRCPLTLDHDALQRFIADLRTVDPRSEEDKTGIGLGVARAAKALKDSHARSKLIVLLTDGQENVWEIPPEQAAKLAKDFQARAYTVVAGKGTRHPFGGWSPLDTSEVEKVATVTGGKFFLATDAKALEAVYEEIDRLEKTEIADPRFLLSERYTWCLVPAVVLLAAGFLLEAMALREVP